MARKPSAAPFKLKYTNGRKADTTAFFQMGNPEQPNPAVDNAIKKKMDQKITQKVDEAMGKEEGGSPVLQTTDVAPTEEAPTEEVSTTEEKKDKGSGWKNALRVVGQSLAGGLDAVYGTGKVAFSDTNEKKEKPLKLTPKEKAELARKRAEDAARV